MPKRKKKRKTVRERKPFALPHEHPKTSQEFMANFAAGFRLAEAEALRVQAEKERRRS